MSLDMGHGIRKGIALITAALLVCGILPLARILPERTAQALEQVTTYDDVRARLELILSETEGLYWNRYVGKENGHLNEESETMLKLAAEEQDYASVCTATRCTRRPRHDENGCQSNMIEGCRQCQGFANGSAIA